MALAENDETTQVELDTESEVEGSATPEGELPEGEGEAAGEGGGQSEETVVTIEGASPTPEEEEEQRAPEWVRELRKSNREKDRRLRELEQENVRLKGTGQQPAAVVVGDKPTLEGCNYDATKFETELESWHARKRDADAQQAEKDRAAQKQNEAWQSTLQDYGKERTALKVRDFDGAEDVVKETLSVVQQGILLAAVDKGRRAVVVYALGKNPKKAQELAAIEDPIKFTAALTKFEGKLNVTTTKKPATQPEKRVSSTVAGASSVDNQLEKLREEARKTGDLSKVIAYNRSKRATAAS